MADQVALLDDRGVVEVTGAEARSFLQRLVTSDVEQLPEGSARYGALLSPQGKILADFLAVATPEGVLLETPAAVLADLARRLTLYKLRAAVTVRERNDLAVMAFPGRAPAAATLVYDDPRAGGMWRRGLMGRVDAPPASAAAGAAFEAARIAAGVPEGGRDFPFGDTFPHDANLDRLHGVDFRKGCYVGQEVVSRVEHRGSARKRIVRFGIEGPAPAPGSAITDGDLALGTFGSAQGSAGLGLVRIDRLAEAVQAGRPVQAGSATLRADLPG